MTLPDYITENPDGSLTVQLGRKLAIGGASVDTVTMREVTLGDRIVATKSAAGLEVDAVLAANVIDGATPAEMHALPSRVFERLQDGLRHFLG